MNVQSAYALILTLLLVPFVLRAASPKPPPTPRVPVTNTYFGNVIVDSYQWLENAQDPSVVAWTRDQNAYTRSFLDKFPARKALEERLAALYAQSGSAYSGLKPGGKRLFALKKQPPKEQPFLVTLNASADPASEKVLLDPTLVDPSGGISIESYFPSPDGSKIAVILAQGGSEQGGLQVYETTSGSPIDERIPRVSFPTGGGSVAWEHDGSGLYYTRYPAPGERPDADRAFYEQVYHHRLGSAVAADTYVLGRDFPRTAEVFLSQRADGRYLRVTVQLGDGGDFAHWLRGPDGAWRLLADFTEGVKAVVFGPDDWLYLFSKKDAPMGRILRLPATNPTLSAASVIVPESEAVIEGNAWRGLELVPNFLVTANALIVVDVLGGPSQVRVFELDGTVRKTVPLPPVSAVDSLVSAPGGEIYFRSKTYVAPPAWYRLDAGEVRIEKTSLVEFSPVTLEDVEVVREFATSKDGTKVPLNIVRKKGVKLDGRNPVLLTGYGGYGINSSPGFLGIDGRLWFDAGGVYAVANLRGGGEFGEAWYHAGRLTRKQNVFDDFMGCAQHLIDRKYTRSTRLAIEGGSNGGLLMGAVLTQRPELFRAVVAHVGLFDMLRVELDANGAFNVPEFGTVTDPDQFRALYQYSPFHRVQDGVRYPGVFLLTGANDGRVSPYHSQKMAARLQAATRSKEPILLRVSESSGHGQGTALSEKIAQQADIFAFLFRQLGMRLR